MYHRVERISYVTKLIVLALACVTVTSCSSSRRDATEGASGRPFHATIAWERFGPEAQFFFNSESTFVICLKQARTSPEMPQQQISFFVVDLLKKTVVHEDDVPSGHVEWKSPHQFQVSLVPGIVEADERPAGYIYDVLRRKKSDLRTTNQQSQ